jgi:hypothetical protein
MPAILPLQANETSRSDGSAATTASLRFVRARATIVVGARAMLLLRLPRATARISTWLAMLYVVAAGVTTLLLVAGNSVSWRKLDFQLNDFIPLLIASISLGDREQFAQTATVVGLRGYDNGNFGRVFWIRIVHCNLKKAEPVKDEPRIP